MIWQHAVDECRGKLRAGNICKHCNPFDCQPQSTSRKETFCVILKLEQLDHIPLKNRRGHVQPVLLNMEDSGWLSSVGNALCHRFLALPAAFAKPPSNLCCRPYGAKGYNGPVTCFFGALQQFQAVRSSNLLSVRGVAGCFIQTTVHTVQVEQCSVALSISQSQ